MEHTPPLAYFITFRCYGTCLHGEGEYTVDRFHNKMFTPFLKRDPHRFALEKQRLRETSYFLDPQKRSVVLEAILDACRYRQWKVFAVHVRSNHVHCVVSHAIQPEIILKTLKSRASRKLKEVFPNEDRSKYWSDHGSTRYIFSEYDLFYTIRYVVEEQGERMAVYRDEKGTGLLL